METIHLKTVDPISQDLLRTAERNNVALNWERYEKLQPPDGFLRLGLSCPYGCLQGPCRIDPFGRGPEQGLCGLNRDGMVAGLFLRLVTQGVLELTGESISNDNSAMKALSEKSLKILGNAQISDQEVYRSSHMLIRPAESPEQMIQQALRLGVLAIHLLYKDDHSTKELPCKSGYGLLSQNQPVIGIVGNPSLAAIDVLCKTASQDATPTVQIVSLGDWIIGKDEILPCACTSGEAELLISSGRISLLLAGKNTDPAIIEICKKLNIPIEKADDAIDAGKILQMAQEYHSSHSQISFLPDAASIGEGQILLSKEILKNRLKNSGRKRISIIGGSDTPHQSLGWIPVELAKALKGQDHQIASWGDAALWMIKDGLTSPEQKHPAIVLDPCQGALQAVGALSELGKLDALSGICFTGLMACHELAVAVGLAAVGTNVCIATPLPIWGSDAVRGILAENLNACGGSLMHFDHPAEAAEILDWFTQL